MVGEFTLAKYKYDPGGLIRSRGFNDGDLSEIALLGAVRREGKVPELLYSVTSHQPRKEIFNVVQLSGTILGQSRSIFLGKVLAILRFFDPGKLEITYCGKSRSKKATTFLTVCFDLTPVFPNSSRH